MILASRSAIEEYTAAGCWGTRTLLDDFRDQVAAAPDGTAVADPLDKEKLLGQPPERITWRQLARAVEGTAAGLRAAGIGKDDVVMVQLPNCWELAMLYLAVARAGGVISPVPMQWRAKELSYVAGLTEAKALVTVESFGGFGHMALAAEIQAATPSLKRVVSYAGVRAMARGEPDPALDRVRVEANDVFTICWTSGTEAQSKGCPLSHNNWRCQAELASTAGFALGDTLLTAGPLVNMGALGTVYAPWLRNGGTMVLHHPFDPLLLLKQLVAEKVRYTLLVPAVLNLILKHPAAKGVDLSGMKAITVGSAPPSLWAMQEFEKRWNVAMGNIWGMNEGTGIVSGVKDVPEIERRVEQFPRYGAEGFTWSVPLTRFIRTKVVDPAGRPQEELDAVGELLYRGPNVMPGYFRRPDLNEKAFDAEGFFRTGDLFQVKGPQYIKFFDRVKDIIIRGGYNISAQEVENVLVGHPGVQEVAAVGMRDEVLGERTCVFAVPRPGATLTLEGIVQFMKEAGVATYKLPERLEVVEAIPRNPVGKTLKAQLRASLAARRS
jgi:acyl-CoA synthetase (AMP-forming)/AMP-acid ligase II